jgi:hypothetical protein
MRITLLATLLAVTGSAEAAGGAVSDKSGGGGPDDAAPTPRKPKDVIILGSWADGEGATAGAAGGADAARGSASWSDSSGGGASGKALDACSSDRARAASSGESADFALARSSFTTLSCSRRGAVGIAECANRESCAR